MLEVAFTVKADLSARMRISADDEQLILLSLETHFVPSQIIISLQSIVGIQ